MAMYRVADLDVLHWQGPVADKDLTSPPGTPAKGARYIIGTSATGGWVGHDLEVTYYTGSAWAFIAKEEGQIAWVKDENLFYYFNGTAWAALPTSPGGGATVGVSGAATPTVTISQDTEKINNTTSYVKLKEMKFNEAVVGTIQFEHSVHSGSTGEVMTAWYKNGVLVEENTEHIGTGAEIFYWTFTNLAANDLVQIYGKRTGVVGNACHVNNFRAKYKWVISAISGEVLATPLTLSKTTVISTTNQDP